jgi:NADH dehydrogenase
MSEPILIVGGGFAGFWAALAAKRVAGTRTTVTMASREPVLQIRPRLYEARPETLGVDLVSLLGKVDVEFVQGEVIALDVERHAVVLATGAAISYSKLVVATGSAIRRPPVPGADDAYSIDTQRDAIDFDRRLAAIASSVRNPTIAVIGAGFTGIELALELRDRLAVHGEESLGRRGRIALIDRAPVVGFELGSGPRAIIEAALAEARVDLHLGVTVTELARDRVRFADGSSLNADAVVLTTGMVAAPFAAHVPGSRDELGRIIVDRSLRAPEAPDVFVAGDAAAAETGDGTGHRTLQCCQHALQLGRFAGENAACDLLGLPLLLYAQPRYVTCLDLGRFGAVLTEGWERAVVRSGAEAKAVKRRINTVVIYPPHDAAGTSLLGLSSVDPAEQKLPVA